MLLPFCFLFFFNDTATTEIYTLSLHDALPIWNVFEKVPIDTISATTSRRSRPWVAPRSEEHTSELQSHSDLVCRLLLEKKKEMRVELLHRVSRFCGAECVSSQPSIRIQSTTHV